VPRCPYCGRWFRTRRGLNVHISKSHSLAKAIDEAIEGMLSIPGTKSRPKKRKRSRRRKRKSEGFFFF